MTRLKELWNDVLTLLASGYHKVSAAIRNIFRPPSPPMGTC